MQLAVKKLMTQQEKKSKMTAIVQNWQDSGLSQIDFANAHSIKLATLRYWILKQREKSNDQSAFIEIGGIVPQVIHIRYPHGVEVVLPTGTPTTMLRSLIHI